jgi:hypothetical protein
VHKGLELQSRGTNWSIACDDNGNYVNQEQIITKNAIAVLDISKFTWQILKQFIQPL